MQAKEEQGHSDEDNWRGEETGALAEEESGVAKVVGNQRLGGGAPPRDGGGIGAHGIGAHGTHGREAKVWQAKRTSWLKSADGGDGAAEAVKKTVDEQCHAAGRQPGAANGKGDAEISGDDDGEEVCIKREESSRSEGEEEEEGGEEFSNHGSSVPEVRIEREEEEERDGCSRQGAQERQRGRRGNDEVAEGKLLLTPRGTEASSREKPRRDARSLTPRGSAWV